MAYKIVNKTQLDYDLKRVADAIRTTGVLSPTANLTFPEGMAEVIRSWSINNSFYDGNYYPSICPDAAKYVLVDGIDLDAKIKTVCDAFRAISFSNDNIQFPDELIRRIECLVIGGGDQPTTYITFYYNSNYYQVLSGTTWEQFADSGAVSGLSVRYVGNDAYIYDYNNESYVGTYQGNSAIKASDVIIEYQDYYSGFEPGSSDGITFYADGALYTVASGTTIKQWLDSGNAPGMYIDNNGYLYNQSAGSYVAEYASLSNGSYEAAAVSRVIYSGDSYYTDSNIQIPENTSSFYLNGYEYEFYEGETWSDVISRLGDYSNIFGHMGTYFGDGVLWDEGQANILLSDDNINNHTFMPVRVTDTIEAGGHYSWENASYFNGSETFTFSNMSTLPTNSEYWYMFNQPVEMQIYDTNIYGTAWTSEDNYTLNLSTSSTNRNVLESYYGGSAQLPDHGVLLSSSNSSGYRYIFYQNAQYNYTADRSELIYPVGKIKLSPGAYPRTFAMWLLANTTSE